MKVSSSDRVCNTPTRTQSKPRSGVHSNNIGHPKKHAHNMKRNPNNCRRYRQPHVYTKAAAPHKRCQQRPADEHMNSQGRRPSEDDDDSGRLRKTKN